MAQFLDYLMKENYQIDFLAMNNNKELNDLFVSYEIVNSMKNKNHQFIDNYTVENL